MPRYATIDVGTNSVLLLVADRLPDGRFQAVRERAEITRQMERILLRDIPHDRGFYWKSAMGYWNRVQQWPPIQGTTVFNFGKFERVWCQGGKCM